MTAGAQAQPEPAASKHRHLLVPIKRSEQVVPVASYAKKLMRQGFAVRISLLFVAPETEAMRQYDACDLAPPGDCHLRNFLARASAFLSYENIVHESLVRYGDIAFTILDIAEQLNCHEIVLPTARLSFIPGFISNSVASQLARRQHNVPVVKVNRQGMPGKAVVVPPSLKDTPSGVTNRKTDSAQIAQNPEFSFLRRPGAAHGES
jgi:nucleotide-binding universal stress UspA family protein